MEPVTDNVYSARDMAEEWWEAGRPVEMRSEQALRTNYDLLCHIDFDYVTFDLLRIQWDGGDTDMIDCIAIMRTPELQDPGKACRDKLEIEWYQHPTRFFDWGSDDALDAVLWFTEWARAGLVLYSER